MKIKTYRITILVGSVSRMLIGVFPYLMPLMLQEGFGLSPFKAGSLFLATMVGNLTMKSATVWIIRHYPFRRVLIVNGILTALFLFITAWLTPDTPVWMILLVLFVTGMSRSLQFSTLTALAFADIPPHQMTSANTLYSTIQQMSIGMGVCDRGCCASLLIDAAPRHAGPFYRFRFPPVVYRCGNHRYRPSDRVHAPATARRYVGPDQKKPQFGRLNRSCVTIWHDCCIVLHPKQMITDMMKLFLLMLLIVATSAVLIAFGG